VQLVQQKKKTGLISYSSATQCTNSLNWLH